MTQSIADPDRQGGAPMPEAKYSVTIRRPVDARLPGLRRLLMGSVVQKTMDAEVKHLDNLKRVLEA